MKKLVLLAMFGLGLITNLRAEKLEPQFRTWKSSQIQCGNYSNVLISSTPIIFHVLNGSAAVNGGNGGNNYFAVIWSTSQPPASDMSTKAFIYTNQSNTEQSGLGQSWDVVMSTSYGYRVYSYFAKQGGACPLFYEWDYYSFPPIQNLGNYFPKD